MSNEHQYSRELIEIRDLMERSTRFLSLSGLAGVLAGIYALVGVYVASNILDYDPLALGAQFMAEGPIPAALIQLLSLGLTVLVLALGSAIFLASKKARKRGEPAWNPTSRRLLTHLAVPLFAGGLLILVMISQGMIIWIAPMTLIFYGLGLYNASKFTYEHAKILGIIMAGLGILNAYFLEYGLLFWALGFGVAHILYGIYMYLRYER